MLCCLSADDFGRELINVVFRPLRLHFEFLKRVKLLRRDAGLHACWLAAWLLILEARLLDLCCRLGLESTEVWHINARLGGLLLAQRRGVVGDIHLFEIFMVIGLLVNLLCA